MAGSMLSVVGSSTINRASKRSRVVVVTWIRAGCASEGGVLARNAGFALAGEAAAAVGVVGGVNGGAVGKAEGVELKGVGRAGSAVGCVLAGRAVWVTCRAG